MLGQRVVWAPFILGAGGQVLGRLSEEGAVGSPFVIRWNWERFGSKGCGSPTGGLRRLQGRSLCRRLAKTCHESRLLVGRGLWGLICPSRCGNYGVCCLSITLVCFYVGQKVWLVSFVACRRLRPAIAQHRAEGIYIVHVITEVVHNRCGEVVGCAAVALNCAEFCAKGGGRGSACRLGVFNVCHRQLFFWRGRPPSRKFFQQMLSDVWLDLLGDGVH
mmetsp:Transcript_21679/g.54566  ORF Transcript_21679/g.54566 Transcript_21679/m.54566 type:complete len:218 (-) Transcript_21679:73-726(-)